jgi:hypothetical protein
VGGPHGAIWPTTTPRRLRSAVHHGGLKHVVAAHLSEQNNRPELARRALAQALGCADADIAVADAAGSGWLVQRLKWPGPQKSHPKVAF